MKNIAIVLSIAFSLFAFAQGEAQKSNNLDHYEIQVDGLGCPFCAYGLEKKFKEFKGIKNVEIEIETGDFSFDYPSDKPLTMEAIKEKVVKAGYTPNIATITRVNGKIEKDGKTAVAVATGDLTSKELTVYGKCGMCKARIEKTAASITGVASANWEVKTQQLKVNFDDSKTSLKDVEDALVKIGHDTKNKKTADSTYDNLPACCHYKRAK